MDYLGNGDDAEEMAEPESRRKVQLRIAEGKAERLFQDIERRGLVRPGISESQLNKEVYELAFELFGIRKYWHKRIVRAGKNTLCPYRDNPPDLLIQPDDIMFFDFGPVFEEWEADFGRTYVLGEDREKRRLQQEIKECWHLGKAYFDTHTDITGNALYAYVCGLAEERGWQYGQAHCGHLIGNFPHEKIQGDEILNYIHPDNSLRMRDHDSRGEPRDWILEVHFIDREREIGGFFEQLLTC